MERTLLERRFGRGAARLALGSPRGAPSLSQLARTRTPGERRLGLLPGIVALSALLAVVLLSISPTRPEERPTDPTLILADAWEVPTLVPPEAAPLPSPSASDDLAEAPPTETEVAAPVELPNRRPAFDLASLTPGASPTIPTLSADSAPVAQTAARPAGIPTERSVADLALAIPRSPAVGAAPVRITEAPAPVAAPARPKASRRTAPPVRARAQPASLDRTGFLASLETPTEAAPASGRALRALPPVSLSSGASARRVREATLELADAEGWFSVPLDALPDCRPAGRQDALKRRILRIAADRPQCAHAEGAYRFLETRNLNAFLMWSRSGNESPSPTSEPRDACVVLERALRCLEDTTSKELEAR